MYANKVMTYSQWQRRFKRALKKTIRKKIETLNLSNHLMLKRIKERAEAQKV